MAKAKRPVLPRRLPPPESDTPLPPPPPFEDIPDSRERAAVPEPVIPRDSVPPPEVPPPAYGGDALSDAPQLEPMAEAAALPDPQFVEMTDAGLDAGYGDGDSSAPVVPEPGEVGGAVPDPVFSEPGSTAEHADYGQEPSGGVPDPSFVAMPESAREPGFSDVEQQQAELPAAQADEPSEKPQFVEVTDAELKTPDGTDRPFEGEPAPEMPSVVAEMERRTGDDAHEILGRQLEYMGGTQPSERAGGDIRAMEGPVDYQLDVNPAMRNYEDPSLVGGQEPQAEPEQAADSEKVTGPLEQMVKLLEELPEKFAEAVEDMGRIG